jgi:hypothetical protein
MVAYPCHTRGLWGTKKSREGLIDEGIPSPRCREDCKAINGKMPRSTERGDWGIFNTLNDVSLQSSVRYPSAFSLNWQVAFITGVQGRGALQRRIFDFQTVHDKGTK